MSTDKHWIGRCNSLLQLTFAQQNNNLCQLRGGRVWLGPSILSLQLTLGQWCADVRCSQGLAWALHFFFATYLCSYGAKTLWWLHERLRISSAVDLHVRSMFWFLFHMNDMQVSSMLIVLECWWFRVQGLSCCCTINSSCQSTNGAIQRRSAQLL